MNTRRGLPIRIPGVFKAKCLRHSGKIGTVTPEIWFDPVTCPAEVLATPFIATWDEAVSEETADPKFANLPMVPDHPMA